MPVSLKPSHAHPLSSPGITKVWARMGSGLSAAPHKVSCISLPVHAEAYTAYAGVGALQPSLTGLDALSNRMGLGVINALASPIPPRSVGMLT